MIESAPPSLEDLNALWLRWNADDHNLMRFGQYVMSETCYRPDSVAETAYPIDLFYETDAQRCYDFILSERMKEEAC